MTVNMYHTQKGMNIRHLSHKRAKPATQLDSFCTTRRPCEFTAHNASDQGLEGIFLRRILMVTCYVRHAPLHSPPAPLSPLAVALPDRGTM